MRTIKSWLQPEINLVVLVIKLLSFAKQKQPTRSRKKLSESENSVTGSKFRVIEPTFLAPTNMTDMYPCFHLPVVTILSFCSYTPCADYRSWAQSQIRHETSHLSFFLLLLRRRVSTQQPNSTSASRLDHGACFSAQRIGRPYGGWPAMQRRAEEKKFTLWRNKYFS